LTRRDLVRLDRPLTTAPTQGRIGWPPEFDIYVERSYQALKAEQTRLLHNWVWRTGHRANGNKRK
jgi:hypothetical protein